MGKMGGVAGGVRDSDSGSGTDESRDVANTTSPPPGGPADARSRAIAAARAMLSGPMPMTAGQAFGIPTSTARPTRAANADDNSRVGRSPPPLQTATSASTGAPTSRPSTLAPPDAAPMFMVTTPTATSPVALSMPASPRPGVSPTRTPGQRQADEVLCRVANDPLELKNALRAGIDPNHRLPLGAVLHTLENWPALGILLNSPGFDRSCLPVEGTPEAQAQLDGMALDGKKALEKQAKDEQLAEASARKFRTAPASPPPPLEPHQVNDLMQDYSVRTMRELNGPETIPESDMQKALQDTLNRGGDPNMTVSFVTMLHMLHNETCIGVVARDQRFDSSSVNHSQIRALMQASERTGSVLDTPPGDAALARGGFDDRVRALTTRDGSFERWMDLPVTQRDAKFEQDFTALRRYADDHQGLDAEVHAGMVAEIAGMRIDRAGERLDERRIFRRSSPLREQVAEAMFQEMQRHADELKDLGGGREHARLLNQVASQRIGFAARCLESLTQEPDHAEDILTGLESYLGTSRPQLGEQGWRRQMAQVIGLRASYARQFLLDGETKEKPLDELAQETARQFAQVRVHLDRLKGEIGEALHAGLREEVALSELDVKRDHLRMELNDDMEACRQARHVMKRTFPPQAGSLEGALALLGQVRAKLEAHRSMFEPGDHADMVKIADQMEESLRRRHAAATTVATLNLRTAPAWPPGAGSDAGSPIYSSPSVAPSSPSPTKSESRKSPVLPWEAVDDVFGDHGEETIPESWNEVRIGWTTDDSVRNDVAQGLKMCEDGLRSLGGTEFTNPESVSAELGRHLAFVDEMRGDLEEVRPRIGADVHDGSMASLARMETSFRDEFALRLQEFDDPANQRMNADVDALLATCAPKLQELRDARPADLAEAVRDLETALAPIERMRERLDEEGPSLGLRVPERMRSKLNTMTQAMCEAHAAQEARLNRRAASFDVESDVDSTHA